MNKEEYLKKKGIIHDDLGLMYFTYFNKDKNVVSKFAIPIRKISQFKYTSYPENGKPVEHTGTHYTFNEAPYEIDFHENENSGVNEGWASGFGDLLRWCYFGFYNPTSQDDKYNKLLEEQKHWKEQEDKEIIMPSAE
ncbi:MAG: hypothetical protein WC428_02055 [Candidatus Paceibacterota bacterium]|jgi:hypothetical protein